LFEQALVAIQLSDVKVNKSDLKSTPVFQNIPCGKNHRGFVLENDTSPESWSFYEALRR
jgi:hypothetical protein